MKSPQGPATRAATLRDVARQLRDCIAEAFTHGFSIKELCAYFSGRKLTTKEIEESLRFELFPENKRRKIGATYWTDYPITELGDKPYKKAPLRKVKLLSYDGNKYCRVKVESITKEMKIGYLYTKRRRLGT